MGIDYDGGMIVGCIGSDIDVPEEYDGDLSDWIEENDLETMSTYYDAEIDDRYIGFCVDDVDVNDIHGEWLTDVLQKAEKFFKLTGKKARLIGTQNIW